MTTTRPTVKRRRLWFLEFYRSAVGKKWVMAVTGIILIGYLLAHMVGNLKMYLGPESINAYGESLRDLGGHLVPRTHLLWIMRIGLVAATALHLHAAITLTFLNWRSRPARYDERHYAAANYASRTMIYGGVIVAAFVVFHLMDLTWGSGGAEFARGLPYENIVHSFERLPVALFYIVANLLLGVHLYHGAWSMFQSIGLNHPRFNQWRRWFAYGIAAVITIGNVSFPIAVQAGIVHLG
ncbi:MAG: succinate dehydrogenase cytochrome b subunit [Actinobacteria bacterium]|nr:succinate dehydrogenase cytochrome b subunit [Actinomycetota bacterium]